MEAVANSYYARPDVIGTSGDFITAPEISQVFGEIIGLWAVTAWRKMGFPTSFQLVECGPGRGTLMADLLRVSKIDTPFLTAAHLHLVERSPSLRKSQELVLQHMRPQWHRSIDTVPEGPMILIANEFLDALPVRQFVKTANGWYERVVGLSGNNFDELPFSFALCSRQPTDMPHVHSIQAAASESVFEHSPATVAFVKKVGTRIAEQGGTALIADYGHRRSAIGDTLQAVRNHQYHPVLNAPGTADLTAHVDFQVVAETARLAGLRVHGPVEQGTWLNRLGFSIRQLQLVAEKSDEEARTIVAAGRRITDPDAMGTLFKIISLSHPDLTDLEGFAMESCHAEC